MSWQERRCNAEGFGRPEPFFFLCEERIYSPPRRSKLRIVRFRRKPKSHSLRCFSFPHKAGFAGAPLRRWYPSLRSGSCALRGGCGSFGSLQTMPQHRRVLLSSSAVLKVVWFILIQTNSAPCENLPPAALPQLWTELAVRPFSFTAAKETKALPCGEQKGR